MQIARPAILFLNVMKLFLLTIFSPFSFAAPDDEDSTYTKTHYPIVLVHGGVWGFDSILGVIDYWYQIPSNLERSGADVYVTQVSNMNNSEVRGEQLIEQIEEILAVTGKDKVHLIGHSQGGTTIRYVGAVIPEKIASLTAVGAPTLPVQGVVPNSTLLNNLVSPFASLFGGLIDVLSGGGLPQNYAGSAEILSPDGLRKFNEQYPNGVPSTACGDGNAYGNGQYLFSWTGAAGFTHIADPIDYGFGPLSAILPGPDDGIVVSCSAHFGKVIRDDYFLNHADEVNQLFGLVSQRTGSPISLYRQHANRLKLLGL